MKFVLHEVKLWFNDEKATPKSYLFLENKINVITGDSTTGKTSFWNIIDYCLLSGRVNIANTIIDKVLWFGIRFTINDKEVSIVRRTPENGAVSSEVHFELGAFPDRFQVVKTIAEIRAFLDIEFGVTDSLRFPFGKEMGKSPFNISYRYFLLFNSLTQTIIDTPETYFDTTFYGKDEYDTALSHIFDLVIGVNDMENIKAVERLGEIEQELKKVHSQELRNQNKNKTFERQLFRLIQKCKEFEFVEYSETVEGIDEANRIVQNVITNTKRTANNSKLFIEMDELNQTKLQLKSRFNALFQYRKEYRFYRKNLDKSLDSLKPIEFLNQKLSDQLVDTYETKIFVNSLEKSLNQIKSSISKKTAEPLKVNGDIKDLKTQLDNIDQKIKQLNDIKQNFLSEGEKFIILGEIKLEYEQILKAKTIKPIDSVYFNGLNEEKSRLENVPKEIEEIKFNLKTLLNKSIQRNFDSLNSWANYKNSRIDFNIERMILQLYPDGNLFPLDNVGSASNFMFMHLCFYLGLHEHVLTIGESHIPEFLFIDQPSTPYYEGKNDDKAKLVDAFKLLDSFIEYITVEKGKSFQIFMVEHAPKDYWIDNNLTHFHLVDEFINGKGLIPKDVYNDN